MNGKHLSWNDRLTIERMILNNFSYKDIAKAIGCCLATIYNEINRGQYVHYNSDFSSTVRYSPDIAEEKYRKMLKNKGRKSKIIGDAAFVRYVEECIIKYKYSPKAILYSIRSRQLHFESQIKSVNTIYNGIRKGYFPNLTMTKLIRQRKIKKHKIKIQKSSSKGISIEKRPYNINDRSIFGHWEMDTVKGTNKNRKCLLVLTERKTRYEIIEPMKSCDTNEVRKALNRIEKRTGSDFYKIFKSITVDNGSEFQNCNTMEKALYRKGKRCTVYYCHPYVPHERGSNENNNLFIRRFLPKGSNFDNLINKRLVKIIQLWINLYPRSLFNGCNALQQFKTELSLLGIKFADM